MRRTWLFGSALLWSGAVGAWPDNWREPVPPFHIVGDIYYVGTKGLAAYLIVSSRGHVLLDGTLAENVPQIEANIWTLGFRLTDVKVLLNSHAHFDHSAGLAQLKRDTGARLLASGPDRPTLESGHIAVANANGLPDMPPVNVDEVVQDGETVRLGPIALKATLTPGHTPGCTTWSTSVMERGRRLRVVFPCSLSVAGNLLFRNPGYSGIVGDYRKSLARLSAMSADVVLPAHPELVDVHGREAKAARGQRDGFIDRGQLPRIVADAQRQFEAEFARQRSGLPPS